MQLHASNYCYSIIVAIELNENDPLKLEHQIVAILKDGCVTLRYLKLTEKEYILFPPNTAEHKPMVMPGTAPNPIMGKAAWWCGKQKLGAHFALKTLQCKYLPAQRKPFAGRLTMDRRLCSVRMEEGRGSPRAGMAFETPGVSFTLYE